MQFAIVKLTTPDRVTFNVINVEQQLSNYVSGRILGVFDTEEAAKADLIEWELMVKEQDNNG